MLIKNYSSLNTSPQRKLALDLIETALESIQPRKVLKNKIKLENNTIEIDNKKYNLSDFEHIYIVGFGKGSSGVCKYLENLLGNKLTKGWDIDLVDEKFESIEYIKGTHPLPSQTNIDYTKNVIKSLSELGENDLVLVVICGGGSAMFESPVLPLEKLDELGREMLRSGADIKELNIVRKHLSLVKGGGLAKLLDPAKIVSLIFSDVPGNDFSTIASGPTTIDPYNKNDAIEILKKYNITLINEEDLIDLPKAKEYFERVDNILIVSNLTALNAMMEKIKSERLRAKILSYKFTGDAKVVGKKLIEECKDNEILLAAGETTVDVKGKGTGGRNQTLVLASFPFLDSKTLICSFGTDGWDFYGYAGAIGDEETMEKAKKASLDFQKYLDDDNSYEFFKLIGDGIDTGKLESNVSDIMMVIKGN